MSYKKMFLVTTANQKFWNFDEPIIFLGEWCKIYSQRHAWSKLSSETLSYYGLDRRKFYQDYIYSMKIYERLLVHLSKELNKIHGSDHSLKYWRIVVGPWLLYFTMILLDRYRSICFAEESGKVKNTWITPEFPKWCLFNDFEEFHFNYTEDDYNHCLFSQVIKFSTKIPWETIGGTGFSNIGAYQNFKSNKASTSSLISLAKIFSRFIPNSLQSLVVVDQSYIKPFDLIKLQSAMKMMPCPYRPSIEIDQVNVDWEMRRGIKLPANPAEDSFESILKKCVPLQIPKVHVEGYATMTQRALEVYPKRTKVILTSIAQKINEGFKLWAATQVEKGAKLVITQHGGHVGDALWSVDDDHDVSIADRYFTWGWTHRNESKVVPMPSSMLASKGSCIQDPKGSIVCVTSSFPRYTAQKFSVPDGPVALETYKLQEKFLKNVSFAVSKHLVFRLFKFSGWEEDIRWRDSKACPNIYKGRKSLRSHFKESRMCVCFYNGTPFLESFSANYPTLLCWDPKYNELNELARPHFDLLRKVGVLHDTPESAASKLNKIYKDPLAWWLSPIVQDAKDKFCDRFARVSEDWSEEWKKELLKLTY